MKNLDLEVTLTLAELIKKFNGAVNVTWQDVTFCIDSRLELSDEDFETVKQIAIAKLAEARQAWINLNCRSN